MATIAAWINVHREAEPIVIEAIRHLWAELPLDARPEDGFALGSSGLWVTAQLMGYQVGHVPDWAQGLSMALQRVAVAFLVIEGTWNYSVYDRGRLVGGMRWYPATTPSIEGDAAAIGSCLGLDGAIVVTYADVIRRDCSAGIQRTKAFPGDRFPAADEYGYWGLLSRMGADDTGGNSLGVES